MKFKEKLLKGTLIKRYKRFFIDIKYKNKIVTAHCPNSGSMMGLLTQGNDVYFSKSDNEKRKLKYTSEIICVNKKLIGINTHLTNKLILEGLKLKKIKVLFSGDGAAAREADRGERAWVVLLPTCEPVPSDK